MIPFFYRVRARRKDPHMNTASSIPPPPEVSPATPVAVGPPARTGGGSLRRLRDLTGEQFGWLTVLHRGDPDQRGRTRWLCKCRCGAKTLVPDYNLKTEHTKSCGCYMRFRIAQTCCKDIKGQRFGRLVARQGIPGGPKPYRWLCECDCGNHIEVITAKLISGHTKSCGCLKAEAPSTFAELTGRKFGRLTVISRAPDLKKWSPRWNCSCTCGGATISGSYGLLSGQSTSCGCVNKERIGAKSPRWDPKLSQEERDRRRHGTPTSILFATVAQQIRARDKATCLVCGEHGTHVHHLEPWALNRDLRYDPANLVTLCKECHNQFHYLYGKDADLEAFKEYLKP